MEGMFLRKKFNIWLFLLFLYGLAFIGMYIFLNIVDPEATGELLIFFNCRHYDMLGCNSVLATESWCVYTH